MDRVLASEAKGRGFDPRQPHQLIICQRVTRPQNTLLGSIAVFILIREFGLEAIGINIEVGAVRYSGK